jgi:hypothetical protein
MTPKMPRPPSPSTFFTGNWGLKLADTPMSITDCIQDDMEVRLDDCLISRSYMQVAHIDGVKRLI